MPGSHNLRPSNKSPLHPSALTINDVRPGRPFIKFNLQMGVMQTGIFTSFPFVGRRVRGGHGSLEVAVRTVYGTSHVFLDDFGITPYPYGWNDVNFTIDARKAHLLPEPKGKEMVKNAWLRRAQ